MWAMTLPTSGFFGSRSSSIASARSYAESAASFSPRYRANARDQEERLDRIVEPIELFVELERLLGELERLDVRMDRGGALRRLPGILGGFVRHLSEQIVVRERRQEVPDALAEHRLVRDRDAPVQLDPPPDEQGV